MKVNPVELALILIFPPSLVLYYLNCMSNM